MERQALQTTVLWPLAVYFFASVAIVAGMIMLSYVLGQRHKGRATAEPYESGMVATGPAHVRFDVKFYLVAMFFVIFDIEAVFIFGWSIAVREAGWAGYVEILVFITIMVCALVYLWRIGALEWGSRKTVKRDTAR